MRVFWACLLVWVTAWAHSQVAPTPADAEQSHVSIADFGLVYPLSNDWVRATKMVRTRVESTNPAPNFDLLLAAVYVPKANMSETSPFFSLLAFRQPVTDCKKSLEAMIADSQGQKDRPETGIEEFSAGSRHYFRVNLARGDWRASSVRHLHYHQRPLVSLACKCTKRERTGRDRGDPQLDHVFASAECDNICAIDGATGRRRGRGTLKSGRSTSTASKGCKWGYGRPVDKKGSSGVSRRRPLRIHSGHCCTASRNQQDWRHYGSRASRRPNRIGWFCGGRSASMEI
jgi:hypothetical protein